MNFLEIETDGGHVHFLVQSIPIYGMMKLVAMIKSLMGRKFFKKSPEVKKKLWSGEFWSDGDLVSQVGEHGDEELIG